jgi:hypothetical protein
LKINTNPKRAVLPLPCIDVSGKMRSLLLSKHHTPDHRKNIEGSNMKHTGPEIVKLHPLCPSFGLSAFHLECPSLVLFGSPTLLGVGFSVKKSQFVS